MKIKLLYLSGLLPALPNTALPPNVGDPTPLPNVAAPPNIWPLPKLGEPPNVEAFPKEGWPPNTGEAENNETSAKKERYVPMGDPNKYIYIAKGSAVIHGLRLCNLCRKKQTNFMLQKHF